MPLALAGPVVDGNERLAEQSVPRPRPAVVVVRRELDRQIGHAELLVYRDLRPHARVAGVGPRVVLPRLVADFTGLGNGLEHPQTLSGSYVETAHGSLDVAAAFRIGAGLERGADDDDVAGDNRRGMETDRSSREIHCGIEIGF